MRGKLTLNLEHLSIDSFDTTRAEQPGGTVFGEQCTCDTVCTCPGCPSCDQTCPASCNGSCGYDLSCTCETWDGCPTEAYSDCNGYACKP